MKKTAYSVEYYRTELAKERKFSELKKTYDSMHPEIKDTNSAKFWDMRLNDNHTLQMEDGMTRERVKTAAKFLPPIAKKIFDIGVGYGFIEEILYKERNDVEFYGNDISPVAIKYIKQRFPGDYKVESLYKMSYKESFFDAVFLLEVLEHIPPSKTFYLLNTIKKMLKTEGHLILSVPMNEGLEEMKDNPNGHVRMYTRPLIVAELKLAGFEVIRYKEIYAFPSMYWLKTQLAKVWRRWEPNNIILLAKSI